MRNKFTKQAQNALALAKAAAVDFELGYIGTEHLLLGLLSETEGTAGRVLEEFQVDGKKLVELIDKLVTPVDAGNVEVIDTQPVYSPRTQKVLDSAEAEAQSTGCEKAGTEHLLLAMLRETDCVGTRLLYTMGVNIQKLYASVLGAMGYDNESIQEEFQAARAMQQGQKGSVTPALDQYSRDLTQMAAEGRLDPVVGRDREITRLIQILSRRTKNNPCLVGEPGVGKTAIAEGLAQRIIAGTVPDTIRDKRLVVLDLSGMVAGSKYRGEFEERIRKVVDEVRENQGILLFIDELHTIIGAGGAEGALDASNILKPSLSRGELQIIGATTLEEYRKYIEKDAALERRFQPITVEEPSEEETYEILKGLRPYYERHHKVEILDEALEAAVKMSVRYINDRFLPDKAIDLIDEAASKVQLSGYQASTDSEELSREIQEILQEKEGAIKSGNLTLAKEYQQKQKEAEAKLEQLHAKEEKKSRRSGKVDEKAVASIVSDWTKIPVQRLTEGETRRLAQLEKELHKRVIGQEEAVHAVSQAVKRGRVGLKDPNRPIGSFLFLGPTGVGKTELSKALAQAVFGSEQAMIRVDLSEYMEKHSVSKLIGSPPGYVGYDEGGQLSEKVRRNPYSVLLFDEIEKAHPDVFNILLQVLDDGHITDAHGRKVDFKQTIIIMTSNAGAQAIVEPKQLGFISTKDEKKDYEKMKSGVMEEVRRLFKPEFLNRIDEIMVFHTLNKEEIRKIVTLLLKSLEERCMEQMDIRLNVTNSAVDYLAEAGFDAKYGARPLRRAIQSKIEDRLANELLEGKIKRGDQVQVQYRNKEIRFIVKDKKED